MQAEAVLNPESGPMIRVFSPFGNPPEYSTDLVFYLPCKYLPIK